MMSLLKELLTMMALGFYKYASPTGFATRQREQALPAAGPARPPISKGTEHETAAPVLPGAALNLAVGHHSFSV